MLCALRGEFSVEGFINPKLILCLLCGMKSLVSFSSLPDLAPSLWSCPDLWHESAACIVDDDMY